MPSNLQPVGSVVAIGARRFVVVGHRLTRDGVTVGAGYALVPYPLGFVDAGSLTVAPASSVDEVVCAGYANEATAAYLEEFEALAQANADVPYDEYAESVRLLQDFAREEAHHG